MNFKRLFATAVVANVAPLGIALWLWNSRKQSVPEKPSQTAGDRKAAFGGLSRREREVALLASRGSTANEIAEQLYVSKRTVESHLVSIYAKLGVASKTELIRRATELGI